MRDVTSALEPHGTLASIRLVRKESSPGSAFVTFTEASAAEMILSRTSGQKGIVSELALSQNPIVINGTPVLVTRPVTREELAERRIKKDPRHLHLATEGHIVDGDPSAEGVPPEEMEKRRKLYANKMKKLEDVNFSVSETRLSVHNIPDNFGPGRLRKIFAVAPKRYARAHPDDPNYRFLRRSSPHITEVRIIEGQRGVGFLEFSDHLHALAALRQVNNNPTYFDDRRLIVEFALISSAVKKKLKEKAALKLRRIQGLAPENVSRITFPDDEEEEEYEE